MIHSVVIFNEVGKPRLMRFYDGTPLRNQAEAMKAIYLALSDRSEGDCCYIPWPLEAPSPKLKVVYRHFATLYFAMVIDEAESELAVLDLIQVFVQVLDACFENVCELDLIYYFDRVHYILEELVIGGSVLESNLEAIMIAIKETSLIK